MPHLPDVVIYSSVLRYQSTLFAPLRTISHLAHPYNPPSCLCNVNDTSFAVGRFPCFLVTYRRSHWPFLLGMDRLVIPLSCTCLKHLPRCYRVCTATCQHFHLVTFKLFFCSVSLLRSSPAGGDGGSRTNLRMTMFGSSFLRETRNPALLEYTITYRLSAACLKAGSSAGCFRATAFPLRPLRIR